LRRELATALLILVMLAGVGVEGVVVAVVGSKMGSCALQIEDARLWSLAQKRINLRRAPRANIHAALALDAPPPPQL
jgi:hypothetical protein